MLDTVFSRLSAAQQKLFPADAVSINHIHVIDTPMLNAFVYPLKAAGVRRSSNLVFITTGLLKKMIDSDPKLLKQGVVRVAGVLGHELAHPLDNMDEEGILTNYGKEIGSQAREVRADSEGAMIAKEAGYPSDAVYESLKRLFLGEKSQDTLHALSSSHPENDLRLAMQRMMLTMDRYEKGAHVATFPDTVPDGLLAELGGIDKGGALGRFVPIKDLSDALARLQKAADEDSEAPHRLLEFNRLMLAVDTLLAKKAERSDAEFELFTEISQLVSRSDSPDILDRAGMVSKFTEETHSTEFLAYPSHETFMKTVPAYNSARYLEWIKENHYPVKKADGFGKISKAMDALVKVLPSEHIFALFGDRIAEDLPGDLRTHPNSRYSYDQSIAKDKSVEFKVRLATLFHQKVMPVLTPEQLLGFFADSTHGEYSYVFPQTRDFTAKNYSLGILRHRTLLFGDSRLKALQDGYRAAMQGLWDKRGYYGTMDLVLSYNSTDWESIFSVLGIDPQLGEADCEKRSGPSRRPLLTPTPCARSATATWTPSGWSRWPCLQGNWTTSRPVGWTTRWARAWPAT